MILERTVTFLVGIGTIGLGLLLWPREDNLIILIVISILIMLLGGYFIIAALIPHKKTVKDVSDETLGYLIIELPIKLIGRALSKVGDFL